MSCLCKLDIIYNQKCTLLNYSESVPDLCESMSHLRIATHHFIVLKTDISYPQQLSLKAEYIISSYLKIKCLHKTSGIIIFNLCDHLEYTFSSFMPLCSEVISGCGNLYNYYTYT